MRPKDYCVFLALREGWVDVGWCGPGARPNPNGMETKTEYQNTPTRTLQCKSALHSRTQIRPPRTLQCKSALHSRTQIRPPEPFNARVRCTPALKSDPSPVHRYTVPRYPLFLQPLCIRAPTLKPTPVHRYTVPRYTGTPYPGTPVHRTPVPRTPVPPVFCSPFASEHPLHP